MYKKQEARQIRQQFWTSLGQYMKPLSSASGEKVNWLNYKTGVKDLYFRMHADSRHATIGIEMTHSDPEIRQWVYGHLRALRNLLEGHTGEAWTWLADARDEDGGAISKVFSVLDQVNVMKPDDWPTMITFFKPRLVALDAFWWEAKDSFTDY